MKRIKRQRVMSSDDEWEPKDWELYHNMGNNLIEILGLKINKNERVTTGIGDKTPYGLAKTVESCLQGNYLEETARYIKEHTQ